MKKTFSVLIICYMLLFATCKQKEYQPVEQVKISRIEQMPRIPVGYKLIDWRRMALDFDNYAFDIHAQGDDWPIIWLDESKRNGAGTTFGLFTSMGDSRMGPEQNGGEFHEGINSIAAVLGASLVGIDKSNQNNMDFVSMIRNYFNSDTGWNIMMNNTGPHVGHLGGGYSWDFWYDVFPNLLFYCVADLYPDEENFGKMMHTIADQFYRADSVLNRNYSVQAFDFGKMQPHPGDLFKQEDAAAAFSWLLYMAYKKFGHEKYLAGSINAMETLQALPESRFWEILMPYGALAAARLNAEEGKNYDIKKIIDWTFDGSSTNRSGWGVIAGDTSKIQLNGLCGSTSEAGGYAFTMNSFHLALPLVPLVRYDQSFAHEIGKWMLNAASNARYFYPEYIPAGHQLLYEKRSVTKGVIAYEGLRKSNKYPDYRNFENISPVALGDGPEWTKNNPDISMFSVYGSSHVGIFGSIISPTNVDMILQLDCLATDFFRDTAYPTYLYYNPHTDTKEINIDVGAQKADLYDAVSRKFLVREATGITSFHIEPDMARLIIIIPAGAKMKVEGSILKMNEIPIDYKL